MNLKKYIARTIKSIKVFAFSRKQHLQIQSSEASTSAEYGKGVRIGINTIITDDVVIGDYSYVNKNSSIECCKIGKYCSISEGVIINPVEHNLDLISTHPVVGEEGHYGLEREPVSIGNDVLISLNVVILNGVKIGDGAVIGAGAVVTHDVHPYEVVAGVPAKHIRFRFSSEKIAMLEEIKWWDWSEEKIKNNISFLRNETEQIIE